MSQVGSRPLTVDHGLLTIEGRSAAIGRGLGTVGCGVGADLASRSQRLPGVAASPQLLLAACHRAIASFGRAVPCLGGEISQACGLLAMDGSRRALCRCPRSLARCRVARGCGRAAFAARHPVGAPSR